MRFVEVTLAAPRDRLAELEAFYGEIPLGETTLRFEACEGEPFYHFALLVPGDRFDAAHAWARERVELLGDPVDYVFTGREWPASSVYFHDPAGNIVELIAHHGVEEHGRKGEFSSDEIVGLAELGLVGDRRSLLGELESHGLALWNGSVEEPDGLAFVGERGRTFILAPTGRGWVPTRRPAEPHPVEARIETGGELQVVTSGPREQDAKTKA